MATMKVLHVNNIGSKEKYMATMKVLHVNNNGSKEKIYGNNKGLTCQ
jgi:hypothetical protein